MFVFLLVDFSYSSCVCIKVCVSRQPVFETVILYHVRKPTWDLSKSSNLVKMLGLYQLAIFHYIIYIVFTCSSYM